jgi:phosphopantothenoylcysteine decarboxylase/phosphopantothenate--cysteine ligase
MGFALAEAARTRGAEVTVVAGVTSVPAPDGISLIKATSADQMYEAVMNRLPRSTVFIGAAAVADYKPAQRSVNKIKKMESSTVLQLERTPDILQAVGSATSKDRIVIGFAAETENVVANARDKLSKKHLDAIVANDVSATDSGFDHSHNKITIVSDDKGHATELPRMTKLEAAHKILDEVVRLRRKTKAAVREVAGKV